MNEKKRKILLIALMIGASVLYAVVSMHNSAGPRPWTALIVTGGIAKGSTCAFFMAICWSWAKESSEKPKRFSYLKLALWLAMLLLAVLDSIFTSPWWGSLWISFGLCLHTFGKLCPWGIAGEVSLNQPPLVNEGDSR